MASDTALVFGASGYLGASICDRLSASGSSVLRATRGAEAPYGWLTTSTAQWADVLPTRSVARVVWAQGLNAAGSILDDGAAQVSTLFEANVGYIVETLRELLRTDALSERCRLVVVSSIWQETGRPDKLAYTVSKAAAAGLVRSLTADLSPRGIAVNAVLPGPVDGPMTRAFLSPESLAKLETETPQKHLVTADDVARACDWLTSTDSVGVNGQFLTVDGGWSTVRHV